MRIAAGRMGLALALLAATGYLLQADDSPHPAPVPAAQARIDAIPDEPPASGRVYVVSRRPVVPLGSAEIRLPILMYHYVRTPPSTRADPIGYRLSVSPEVFQSQMDWLALHGYHPVNFNQVRDYFAGRSPLPSDPVVITIDDGYQDLYTAAFPILRAHRFTAVAYIVSGFVDQPLYVSSDDVVELDRAGIEIGSHTVDHRDLAQMSAASATYEVVESKRWLENLIGHPVDDFAYPSGRFNPTTIAAVMKAGYDTAVTTSPYPITHSLSDRYTWSRVRVTGGELLPEFIASLGSSMRTALTTRVNLESTPFQLQQRT